jgi:hypothetical protein
LGSEELTRLLFLRIGRSPLAPALPVGRCEGPAFAGVVDLAPGVLAPERLRAALFGYLGRILDAVSVAARGSRLSPATESGALARTPGGSTSQRSPSSRRIFLLEAN